MSLVFVGRGDATLGRVDIDAQGNKVQRSMAHWVPDPEGGSVAVGLYVEYWTEGGSSR